jgi:hypothetical protein
VACHYQHYSAHLTAVRRSDSFLIDIGAKIGSCASSASGAHIPLASNDVELERSFQACSRPPNLPSTTQQVRLWSSDEHMHAGAAACELLTDRSFVTQEVPCLSSVQGCMLPVSICHVIQRRSSATIMSDVPSASTCRVSSRSSKNMCQACHTIAISNPYNQQPWAFGHCYGSNRDTAVLRQGGD